MSHLPAHRLSRWLLAVMSCGGPLLAHGTEVKLAPVIDLNPRHQEAASHSLEEPQTLADTARAVPLLSGSVLPTVVPGPPVGTPDTHRKPTLPMQPTVRSATPFDPTAKPVSPIAVPAAANPVTATIGDSQVPVIRLATRESVSKNRPREKKQTSVPPSLAVEASPKSMPVVKQAPQTPIASARDIHTIHSAKATSAAKPHTALPPAKHSSPVVTLATSPVVLESPAESRLPSPSLPTQREAVLKLVEKPLPEQSAPSAAMDAAITPVNLGPVIQFADRTPLLAILQPSRSASDLPSLDLPSPMPMPAPPMTEEEIAVDKQIEAFERDVKPINQLSVHIKPETGEMPRNYATTRFAREGAIAHHMGYSRAQIETEMNWEAPGLCHRPLYFEDVNLERYGYKVPLVQPAISAAHFFGRVPLLPYMIVSEGHRKCQYTLGHYQPGDYAPYSLYVPRLRLDASAVEVAFAAGLIFAFP